MKLKDLLEKKHSLVKTLKSLQDNGFAISALQDTKPSSLLNTLRSNITKSDFLFSSIGEEGVLDSLCKVFAISHPYSSIGMVNKENTVYISLAQETKINIKEIINITKKLVNSDLTKDSCVPIVKEFYKVLYESGNQYVKKILDLKESELEYSLSNDEFYQYAAKDAKIFDNYFNNQDIKNIKYILDQNLNFQQVIPQKDQLHVHVELNLISEILISEILKNYLKADIHIGLAISNIKETPGSCGYCTATMNSIQENEAVVIHRSRDFPQNMPVNIWDFPYKLINTATKSYAFFKNLYKQYMPVIQKNKGNEEAFLLLKQKLEDFSYIDDISNIEKELTKVDIEINSILGNNLVDTNTQTDITQNIDSVDSMNIMIMGNYESNN